MFSGLQFRGIGGQEAELNARRTDDGGAGVEARAIDEQDNPFGGSSLAESGKFVERGAESGVGDHRHEQPEGSSGRGMNEAVDIRPLIAVMNKDARTNPSLGPDPAQDRLETNTVFIHRPKFDTAGRRKGLKGVDILRERFF